MCSLKHGDLERLHKGVHSERRVLASLEGGVRGERERERERWVEYSGGNGRLGGDAEYLVIKIVDLTGSIL